MNLAEQKPKEITLTRILPQHTVSDVLEYQKNINNNIAKLDRFFEELEEHLGRDLTEDEQSAVFDIVDECSPKDK